MKEWRSRSRADLKKPDATIFFPQKAKTWGEHLREYIFGPLGLKCTSHSVRRSAAQWAGRCGADLSVVRNVGRWECLSELLKYTAEGNERNIIMMRDHTVDPIFEFWPFFPKTAVSSMSSTMAQFNALRGGQSRVQFN
jgi:CubicO group peptidase (beta-lactamase class C family)